MFQTCGSQHKDASVHTEPDLHGNMLKEILILRKKEIERLKIVREVQVNALKNKLEVRNMPKVCFTITSW